MTQLHEDAGDYKRSRESVSHEAVHITPLPLPWDPGNDRDLPGVVKTGPCRKVWQEDSQERLEVKTAPQGTMTTLSGLQGQVGCKNPPAPSPRHWAKTQDERNDDIVCHHPSRRCTCQASRCLNLVSRQKGRGCLQQKQMSSYVHMQAAGCTRCFSVEFGSSTLDDIDIHCLRSKRVSK